MNPYIKDYLAVVERKNSSSWRDHHKRYIGELTPENIAKVAHGALRNRTQINYLIWEALGVVFDESSAIFYRYKHDDCSPSEEGFVRACLAKLTTTKEPNLEEWL